MNIENSTPTVIAYEQALSLVCRVYHALDAGDADRLFACFARDAIWHRPEGAISGEAAIRAIADKRPAGRVTTHCVSNLVLEGVGTAVIAHYYLTVYGAAPGVAPYLVSILDCRDELTVDVDGPRIATKQTALRMKFVA